MRTLDVALDARSYPIYIGRDLLSRGDLFAPVSDCCDHLAMGLGRRIAPPPG